MSQRYTALFLMPFITVAMFVSVVTMASGLLQLAPKEDMRRWKCLAYVDNPDTLSSYLKIADRLPAFFYYDPELLQTRIQMGEWAILSKSKSATGMDISALDLVNQYKSLAALRPTAPTVWLGIIRNKIMAQQIDDELKDSISSLFKLSPYQSGVQLKLVRLNMAIWNLLPHNIQEQTKGSIVHLMKNSESHRNLILAAVKYDWLPELERLVTDSELMALISKVKVNPSVLEQLVNSNRGHNVKVC